MTKNDKESDETVKESQAMEVKACNDVLNRDQTEEWKGWMQIIFLLYHYYHAAEVYNSIRIMITCYVWMTGFGNFSFFYLKSDFSLVRVLQMVWRLNFLVFFLCLSQGTTYILYYICPLHTFYFFLVYCTMATANYLNYSKFGLRFKLAVVAFAIFLVWDVNLGFFNLFHFWISSKPAIGATKGTLYEWYFRTTLDHWSAFLGMVFAANFPITSLFVRKLEAQPSKVIQVLAKAIVGIGLLLATYLWFTGPFLQPKHIYNATNAYFGFIPLITYIYFRNISPTLRGHSIDLFHNVGKTTLETYLMQHHIWLTSNAKSLLILVPGFPKVNMLLVTFIYVIVSKRLYKLTMFLRGMFLPDRDRSFCIRSYVAIFTCIFSFYAIALSLAVLGLVSLPAIAIICLFCGFCLYQTIIEYTWLSYRQSAPPLSTGPESFLDDFMRMQSTTNPTITQMHREYESSTAKLTPPIIGLMVLMITGLFFQGIIAKGAGKIVPLSYHCEPMLNEGLWIPAIPCNDAQKGYASRDLDIASMVCTSSAASPMIWAWKLTESNTHCQITHRDLATIKNQLSHRKVVFVGDSMVRSVYFALLRALGVKKEFYDATIPRHSDLSHHIKSDNILVEFKWAPLAADQAQLFSEYISLEDKSSVRPDVVIAGGGAWDRLHALTTDNDLTALKASLDDLAKKMISCRDTKNIPVAWIVPTVINTNALNDDKKREYMKEEDMQEMRLLHASHGILSSSSFVLDGPSFTQQRVEESYDGVHYPPEVYNAGAQILANAFDWILLPLPNDIFRITTALPQPGSMSNPALGLMMLCFIFIALLFFDGLMGFSFLASVVARGVMPSEMYEEAFIPVHEKFGLPRILLPNQSPQGDQHDGMSMTAYTERTERTLDQRSLVTGNKSYISGDSTAGGATISTYGNSTINNTVDDKSMRSFPVERFSD